jgi:hypothetical protein
MRIPTRTANQTPRRGGRPGGVSVYLLLSLPVMILAAGMTIYIVQAVELSIQTQNSADAASLAGVQTLVDDDVLLDNPGRMLALLERSRRAASRYAAANPIFGDRHELDPNRDNEPDGDIVFGSLSTPLDGTFTPIKLTPANKEFGVAPPKPPGEEFGWAPPKPPGHPYLPLINTVRVGVRKSSRRGNPARLLGGYFFGVTNTDISRQSTATLDGFVIGFRPLFDNPIPLAPIGLYSDPGDSRGQSWECQVEQKDGGDTFRFDRDANLPAFASAGDGLHEMTARLLSPGESKFDSEGRLKPNACLLQIQDPTASGHSMDRLVAQIKEGVSRDDLAMFKGEFVLDRQRSLTVPGLLEGPAPLSRADDELREALGCLLQSGKPVVWPLFSRIDPKTSMPVVTGFVAARVMAIRPAEKDVGLSFVLQPARIAVPGAITVTDSPDRVPGVDTVNRYICKIRLVP